VTSVVSFLPRVFRMSAAGTETDAGADPSFVLPLPELPASQQGTSTASHRNYKASVSNAAGYLCHIELECNFDVSPQVVFDIFCHPDNAGAFRDIKMVGYRKVKMQEPNYKVIEVEQCGELRVLWISRIFRTYLDVTEDARDQECLKTDFKLLRSDLLARFHGSWDLRPRRDAAGNIVGCHAVLKQDVLPKGCPSFFAHLPVLGGLLRRVSLNTIQRLVEDILNIVNRYTTHKGQKSLDDIMAEIAAERGHKTIDAENRGRMSSSESEEEFHSAGGAGINNSSSSDSNHNSSSDNKVASFALDNFSEDESTETEYEDAAHEHADGGSHLEVIGKGLQGLSVGRISSDAEVMVTPSSSAGGVAETSSNSSKEAAAGEQHQLHERHHKHGVEHKHRGGCES
jgi:hypothetical protein